ncbi:MAG: efflux RND transporter periplasmic adaptor subunit [Syntrophobacterales bacterium]|jgi:Cu(I)/Ag(I) efflux system membrane fusion protein/cobalt-zinc-cadmium efflux system membrane fusion protein
MKRLVITALVVLLAAAIGGWIGMSLWSHRQANNIPGAGEVATQERSMASKKEPKAEKIDPKTGKKIKYWVAPMDPTYIRDEPGKSPMGMDLVPVYEEEGGEKEPTSTIRIDPVTLQNMGVRTAPVQKKPLVKYIRTFGNIRTDETKLYEVNTKFAGWIEKLYVEFEGKVVKKGQPLFDIYSPELLTAQEEYLLALHQYETLSSSAYPSIREGAERLLHAARTRLLYWDLTEKQIEQIEKTGKPRKTLTVYSPASGVVVIRKATEGRYFKPGKRMYKIADLSTVWVDVDVYEYDLPWVAEGMPAEMELPYTPGKRFNGKVLYIYPYLNPQTRTATVRLEFPNPKYELKLDMYANVYLKSTIAEESLVVPQEALIRSGVRNLVFVSLGKGRFQPREVKLGLEGNENEYQVLEGLREGEEIVISAQFMLDSESRLREAIQKMLDVRSGNSQPPSGVKTNETKEDDLDMSGLTMEDEPNKIGSHQY